MMYLSPLILLTLLAVPDAAVSRPALHALDERQFGRQGPSRGGFGRGGFGFGAGRFGAGAQSSAAGSSTVAAAASSLSTPAECSIGSSANPIGVANLAVAVTSSTDTASSATDTAAAAATASSTTAAAAGNGGNGKGGKGGKGGAGGAAAASSVATATDTTGTAVNTAAAAASTTAAAVVAAVSGTAGQNVPVLNGDGSTTLDPKVIQTTVANGNATILQSASATSNNNFINFCSGQTITNGLQVQGGSCNPIIMGQIPDTANMISATFTNPKNLDTIPALQTFNIEVASIGLETGVFTDAKANYYSAPQQVNSKGQVVGHIHVVAQLINGFADPTPPIPTVFAFFKGIDAQATNGVSTAVVQGGLAAGTYRLCTIVSAANHQSAVMPVAQRGAENTCSYFTAK